MQWILLIGDETFTLSSIKAVEHKECIQSNDVPEIKGRNCVVFDSDHIFYD